MKNEMLEKVMGLGAAFHDAGAVHGVDRRRLRIADTHVGDGVVRNGILRRQLRQVEEFTRLEAKKLPPDLDYRAIAGLRLEAREKLEKIRPENFGQAGRISGVSPADLSVLMIWMEGRA